MRATTFSGALAGLLFAGHSFAQDVPTRLAVCAGMSEDRERLVCYDRVARDEPLPEQERAAEVVSPQLEPEALRAGLARDGATDPEPTYLSRYWELDQADKRGTFHFQPHRENFLIATYNRSPNIEPYLPLRRPGDAIDLSETELKFQIGFKLKITEAPAGLPVDLWFGYTQLSFWQASNRRASSPFRETDYQPEFMAVVPLDINLAGVKLKFANLGFLHESNGQTNPLSRSWNRTYLQIGFERGNFTLLTRVWKRINESRENDDNPDIVDFMGRGDVVGTWRSGGHELSLLTRYNFSTDKGALQLGWAFPLARRLKGYVQYFSGYGHSLIDYNGKEQVLGLGLLVTY